MDPISIGASCLAVVSAAAKTTSLIRQFVRTYRNAHPDLARLNREISDLDLVLVSIQNVDSEGRLASAGVPKAMQDQLSALIRDCTRVLGEIQSVLTKSMALGRWDQAKWAMNGKEKIDEQVALLEGHRKALDLSMTTIDFSLSCNIKADTTALRVDAEENKDKLEEILNLLKLSPAAKTSPGGSDVARGKLDMMSRYLDSLSDYATSVYGGHTEVEEDKDEATVADSAARETQAAGKKKSGPPLENNDPKPGKADKKQGDKKQGDKRAPSQDPAPKPGSPDKKLTGKKLSARNQRHPDAHISLEAEEAHISGIAISKDGAKVACTMGNKLLTINASSGEILTKVHFTKHENTLRVALGILDKSELFPTKPSFVDRLGHRLAVEIPGLKEIEVWDVSGGQCWKERTYKKVHAKAAWTTSPYPPAPPGASLGNLRMAGMVLVEGFRDSRREVLGYQLTKSHRRPEAIWTAPLAITTNMYSELKRPPALLGTSGNGRRVFRALITTENPHDNLTAVVLLAEANARTQTWDTHTWPITKSWSLASRLYGESLVVNEEGTRVGVIWNDSGSQFKTEWHIWVNTFTGDLAQLYAGTVSSVLDMGNESVCALSPSCKLFASTPPSSAGNGDRLICITGITLGDGDSVSMDLLELDRLDFVGERGEGRVEHLEFSSCSRKLVAASKYALCIWDLSKKSWFKTAA
ncbi:hypothetical protein B0H63DRAFT_468445 [Podospora didyma]|uniref:Azaphilone pigments biosynthesis cluster protein L N-terminal domain-containing protein n=1 Tax=Podospora didyma TaxID=330526 RepID=A0AAE0U0U8_9PEZI|nr:hypothetical protein B0H63DRAFT_468445 [Podospora didyma]